MKLNKGDLLVLFSSLNKGFGYILVLNYNKKGLYVLGNFNGKLNVNIISIARLYNLKFWNIIYHFKRK